MSDAVAERAFSAPIGVVVGLEAEARLARRLGVPVEIGGGHAEGALAAASRLVARGVSGLVSFGLAGGLDPALAPGAILVPPVVLLETDCWNADPALMAQLGGPSSGTLYGGGHIVATAAAKAALHARTGAVAVDLESAAVAQVARRHGLPFAALRAVCDPASRDLPQAAVMALDATGQIGAWRVGSAIMARPWQIPALIRLASDAARARHMLVTRVRALGQL